MNSSNTKSDKRFVIMIGRSGCGKGTQAELLRDYLKTVDGNDVLHITTGGNFREFLKSNTYSSEHSKEIIKSGGLMPEFLAVWNWSSILIEKLVGEESVILDGAPRKMLELTALNTAIEFYSYKNPLVIYLDVSESWAKERLAERGREDDNDEAEISKKMSWFEMDVLPCVDWYKNVDKRYTFLHINGERSIDEIHEDIISRIN